MRRRLSHFGLVALICAPALAQKPLLDLGAAPKPPAAGQGAGAIALADELRDQGQSLANRPDDREHARAAARMLARTLLTSGESMGPDGSMRIVLGRTLARGLPEIDRAIGALEGETGAAQASLLATDLTAAARSLDDPKADPWRETRDGFALLSRGLKPDDRTGWIDESLKADEPLAGEIDRWSSALSFSAVDREALVQLDALATAGVGWPAYHAAAVHLRRAAREACDGMSSLPEPTRSGALDQFKAALHLPAEQRAAAFMQLRRIARLAALALRVQSLDDAPAIKRLRTELARALSEPAPTDAAAESARLAALERTLALLHPKLPDERTIVRQLRPAWRVLAAALRPTEQKLVQALPEVLTRADAATDPGITSAIAAQRRAVQDIDLLLNLNTAMADQGTGEPGLNGLWKLAADRAFKLGQDLAKPTAHDEALAGLRELASQTQDFNELPGEAELKAASRTDPSAWSVLTGGQTQPLLAEIAGRRGTWLSGWDRNGFAAAPAEVARLRALRDLMAALDDAAAITPASGDFTPQFAALNAWPGFELSTGALAALTAGLREQTVEATRLITAGDAPGCAKITDRIRTDYAAALLIGRLAREAADRKVPVPAPTLLEAAAGGPVEGLSWQSGGRLAELCRYAEEIPAARKLGAKDRAGALLRYVNARAGE